MSGEYNGRYYAKYSIQPDDANHLEIYTMDGKRVIYVRVRGRELAKLLRGELPETTGLPQKIVEDYKKIAELFRDGKIEYIEFLDYPVGRKFKYKVEPSRVKITNPTLLSTEYVLDLDDRKVVLIPNQLTVLENVYMKREERRIEPRTRKKTLEDELDQVINHLKRIIIVLERTDRRTRKENLLTLIETLTAGLTVAVRNLERIKREYLEEKKTRKLLEEV